MKSPAIDSNEHLCRFQYVALILKKRRYIVEETHSCSFSQGFSELGVCRAHPHTRRTCSSSSLMGSKNGSSAKFPMCPSICTSFIYLCCTIRDENFNLSYSIQTPNIIYEFCWLAHNIITGIYFIRVVLTTC